MYNMQKCGRVIQLHSEELSVMDRHAVQQMIDKMQAEIEKQKELMKEKDREIEDLKQRFKDQSAGVEQEFELNPDNYNQALEKIYEIISRMDKYTTEEVLFYTAQVLSEVMDSADVAIYTIANRNYARLFSATSSEARKLGNSIKYTDMDVMYNELKNGRIYMNKSGEEGLPLMAGAIYTEKEIKVILMFWGISGRQATSSDVKRLTVIETLLQNAILRAIHYLANFRSQRYLEGTNVLNQEAFTVLLKAFLEAKSKGLTECALLEVMMGYEDYESVSIQVACNIRQTDYMGAAEGGKLYILLCNTDSKSAEFVQERLRKLGYKSELRDTVDILELNR